MAKTSFTILSAMPTVIDYYSTPILMAGYYGPTTGLNTVQIQTMNFQGRVWLQGTLSTEPQETDWFTIPIEYPAQVNPGPQQYINYPRTMTGVMAPIYGLSIDWYTLVGMNGESSTIGFNFICNCYYIRAYVQRSHFLPSWLEEVQVEPFGIVDSILLNY